MVELETAVDALLTTECRNPAVASEEQTGGKTCRNTEAIEPKESPAVSLEGVSRAESRLKLVPSILRAGLASAKEPCPIPPQHVPDKSDDVEAEEIIAADVNTFPISYLFDKDARGLYTLSGSCCLCGQTFRAVGSVVKGKAQPWHNHARLQHNIVQHARTHGAVGFRPHRNLDEMRLDWVRSLDETSEDMVDASASRDRKIITPSERKSTIFCTGCSRWRRTNRFRCGASTCSTCLKITCGACGKSQRQTQYRTSDVYIFLNRRSNIRCRTCRRKGTTMGGSKHKIHKGGHCRRSFCTRCGVYQAVSAFRRMKGKGRMDICKSCELVPCAACAAMLSRGNFAECDIRKYFSFTGVKHITCLVCKKQRRHARQQRLQEHKKKSKRKDYTRKHSQAPTRTCLPEDFAKWDIRRYFSVASTKNGCERAA